MFFSSILQHYASRSGKLKICEILIQFGANVNLPTRSGKVTCLHRAASKGQIEVIKLLLDKRADPSVQDSDGKTALHRVCLLL